MRIKEIWDREGKTGELSLEDFDPSRLKEILLTDPASKTELWFNKQSDELLNRIDELRERLNNTLVTASNEYFNLINYRKPMIALLTVIDAFRKDSDKKSIIKKVDEKTIDINSEFEEKKAELLEKLQSDPTFALKYAEEFEKAKNKFVKETENVKKEFYDYEFDPERRFVVNDYSKITDDELVEELNNQVIYNSSWLKRNLDNNYNELNRFVNSSYNDYYNGKYATDEELKIIQDKIDLFDNRKEELRDLLRTEENLIRQINQELNYDDEKIKNDERVISANNKIQEYKKEYNDLVQSVRGLRTERENLNGGILLRFNSWGGGTQSYAITFKDAVKNYKKLANKLRLLGIKFENIESAKEEVKEQITKTEEEITKLEELKPIMFAKFLKEFNERQNIAPSVLFRVDEFSSANKESLIRDLVTFGIDKQKLIKVEETEKVKIKPIVEQPTQIIETDTIKNPKFVETEEIIEKVETEEEEEDLKFLENKLKATEDLISLLEMTDEDSEDLVFLNELKIATKDLISLLEMA
jgi:hypothetical protein